MSHRYNRRMPYRRRKRMKGSWRPERWILGLSLTIAAGLTIGVVLMIDMYD